MSDKKVLHQEPLWPGREVIYDLKNDWVFDHTESFPKLDNLTQRVQIGDFEGFGRCLVIDGITQIGEAIDKIYTDALIYPPMILSKSRKKWFIAGGGDGAAAREILKSNNVEKIELVDISKTVIEKTQEFIPSFWNNCQKDKRLDIKIDDVFLEAKKIKNEGKKLFDVVVMDLTDFSNEEYTPFKHSTADHLYTEEGLRNFHDILSPEGIFVVQSQELSIFSHEEHKRTLNILKKIFPEKSVFSYRIFIELFNCWQSFIITSPKANWNPLENLTSNKNTNAILSDMGIAKNDQGTFIEYLKSMFALPPEIKNKLN